MNATRSARLLATGIIGIALGACADRTPASISAPRGLDGARASLHAPAPRARLALRLPAATIAQSGITGWMLTKTGAVDPDDNFKMKYELIERNAKHVDAIARAVKDARKRFLR